MVNAAIIGLGWWGRTLVQSVQGESSDIHFIAGATGRKERAVDFAAEQKLQLHDSLEEVLQNPDVEAVVLATPHLQHADQIIAAARAGKHVFVEKPFTMDKESAQRAVQAVEEAGVTLGLGHNRRFHPHMETLKNKVDHHEFGTLLHCEGTMTSPSGLALPKESWRVNPKQSPAGGLAGLGIHMVDSMIALLGPVESVVCQSVHRAVPSGADDTTSILLRFQSGATGVVSCMTATPPSYRFTLYGSKAMAEITSPGLDNLTFTPLAPDGTFKPELVDRSNKPGVNTLRLELEEFARASRGEGNFRISHSDMIAGAAAFEAIAQAAVEGGRVQVK
ncbi:Gfo/Idh/MocA family oxidoreductase [Aureimonas fodinaquatilis]|uniref:Gfo/Idh/MocA family oxidoreductase n=1 Tax=Aureimonas fodinaquatilis TaxID=2565783 RepID=A0A5B0DRZ8_9HYPH|nr:Gfo/Idh/MocA family oxidoreductase [Aureimonas fodinaquatilis]KAA0969577.1 Gfo/Idh/MocA family oxidoreductase [Aureimonas fodinaquatilis]